MGSIGTGLLVLLGVEEMDEPGDVIWLSQKITSLRIFNDGDGQMNKSLLEVRGQVLVVSQFTLYAATKKGARPSYIRAARPQVAQPLYEAFVGQMERDSRKPVACGVFGAHMEVALVNDGPVTIIIDTKAKE